MFHIPVIMFISKQFFVYTAVVLCKQNVDPIVDFFYMEKAFFLHIKFILIKISKKAYIY